MTTPPLRALLLLAVLWIGIAPGHAEAVRKISQHGITWHFAEAVESGRFVNGDFWVLGPVEVTSIDPAPGPVDDDRTQVKKNQYGASGLRPDRRMRNGSMIVERCSPRQGYDSRLTNFDPQLSAPLPLTLGPGQSLISTVSSKQLDVQVLHHKIMWRSEKRARLALWSAAVLTCLEQAPPADAFRPPYAGTWKPLFRFSELHTERLASLPAAGRVPNWTDFSRYLERPWLDHTRGWLYQRTGPAENMPSYGREICRITGIASLMLQLDVPPERKRELLVGMVQLGIDFAGLAKAGRNWSADGGHYAGRKWPILFAGLLLDDGDLRDPSQWCAFQEDLQTYYGSGWAGQEALWQMVNHSGPKPPYEEKPPEKWNAADRRSESYRKLNGGAWPATALAARIMGATRDWNHDAYFDYVDRWMNPDDPHAKARGKHPRPPKEGKAIDGFVDAMWHRHRAGLEPLDRDRIQRKWVQENGKGHWIENREPAGRRED